MAKSLRQRRHKARILAMQGIFQLDARGAWPAAAAAAGAGEAKGIISVDDILDFNWMDYAVPEEEREFARKVIRATVEHADEIDKIIRDRLMKWDFERISPVSRAILRTGIAQLLYVPEEADAAVVIDECILLAKQYDAIETAGFVNGLLDDVRRTKHGESEVLPEKPAPLAQKIVIRRKATKK